MVYRTRLLFILGIFFIALLPFAATLVQHYADEWHYINAVLLMLQTGDYLTPHNRFVDPGVIGGLLRLNKPILTYWAVLAGCKIFGVHIFSVRLGFLLAGTLTLVLTALIAQTALQKPTVTEFALLILITQISFLLASIRAIPDILLTLFLTLSVYGVFCLLTSIRHRWGWWCFYLGAALALASKGLLALVFLIYAEFFLLLMEPQLFKNHRGTQLCAGFIALIIGFGWYVLMWVIHGNVMWQAFFHDQIAVHTHHPLWLPLVYMPLLAGFIILIFLPWSVLSAEACRQERPWRVMLLPRARIYQFTLIWVLIWICILGLGNNLSSRYLLPLTPLLSIVMADSICQLSEFKRQQFGRGLLFILIPWLIIEGLLGFSVIGQLVSLVKAVFFLLIFLAAAAGLWRIIHQKRANFLIIAAWTMFFSIVATVYPLSALILPEQAEQIVTALNRHFPDGRLQPDLISANRLASNIRLLSNNRIDPNYIGKSIASHQPPRFPLLIDAESAQQLHLPAAEQQKIVLSRSLEGIPPLALISGIFTWTLPEQINLHAKEYWLILAF